MSAIYPITFFEFPRNIRLMISYKEKVLCFYEYNKSVLDMKGMKGIDLTEYNQFRKPVEYDELGDRVLSNRNDEIGFDHLYDFDSYPSDQIPAVMIGILETDSESEKEILGNSAGISCVDENFRWETISKNLHLGTTGGFYIAITVGPA